MQHPDRMILSCARDKNGNSYRKVNIRPVLIRSREMWQVERFTDKQAFHENLLPEELPGALQTLLEEYMQLDSWSSRYTAFVKISRKGKVLYRKKPVLTVCGPDDSEGQDGQESAGGPPFTGCSGNGQSNGHVLAQNREKKYLLEAADAPAPLVDLGVVTKEGKVAAKRYDKFKQINRFVEVIDDSIGQDVKELQIVDFGCGKSYLTFVLYDYLCRVRGIRARIIGLDLKEEVIRDCNRIARRYGYEDLSFQVGDINGFVPEGKIDMVISLHACDTATDFALYNAVSWGTPRIFSVPCCQHELNYQMGRHTLGTYTEYGLIKERMAALMTDALRADMLKWQGYRVDVLEFVDMQHSPKNLLLRCVKQGQKDPAAKARVEEAMRAAGIHPTLWKLLMTLEKQDGNEENDE
ncbi:MAG: SAM-dependent methyltransferase [Lachnospiraceae bacterium]|nr:SAM-dependent methyltransferase [Lachnospiraceae bacterium]